jgi:hypothetical protein
VNVVVASLIDAVITNEPVLFGGTFNANEAVVANEAEIAVSASEAEVATTSIILMLLPNPFVKMLPEICTRSS